MKLFIDTSDREKITLGLDSKKFVSKAGKDKSQRLLSFIDKVLGKEGKTFKDITEIKVATGPGSFTGLRVGVAVANTLGWVLGAPVNGKDVQKGQSVDINYEN